MKIYLKAHVTEGGGEGWEEGSDFGITPVSSGN